MMEAGQSGSLFAQTCLGKEGRRFNMESDETCFCHIRVDKQHEITGRSLWLSPQGTQPKIQWNWAIVVWRILTQIR